MKTPDTSLPEDEYKFDTLGTSIEDAFGDYEDEEDVDDVDFDSMDDPDE